MLSAFFLRSRLETVVCSNFVHAEEWITMCSSWGWLSSVVNMRQVETCMKPCCVFVILCSPLSLQATGVIFVYSCLFEWLQICFSECVQFVQLFEGLGNLLNVECCQKRYVFPRNVFKYSLLTSVCLQGFRKNKQWWQQWQIAIEHLSKLSLKSMSFESTENLFVESWCWLRFVLAFGACPNLC